MCSIAVGTESCRKLQLQEQCGLLALCYHKSEASGRGWDYSKVLRHASGQFVSHYKWFKIIFSGILIRFICKILANVLFIGNYVT